MAVAADVAVVVVLVEEVPFAEAAAAWAIPLGASNGCCRTVAAAAVAMPSPPATASGGGRSKTYSFEA